jgi:secreted PhoX family phosphatase
MKTSADPTGTKVVGMINECAGGITPWGHLARHRGELPWQLFGQGCRRRAPGRRHKRYGVPGNSYNWGAYYGRFDVAKEPNEANRFGWIVEIDPFDPLSTPRKRTALGRFKCEGAMGIFNKDGRYVVYSGDDERFEYVYKFVTAGTVDTADPAANRDLLDNGTLYVARYDADGTVTWLPPVHGERPLTAENGFTSQADVVIEVRRAADLLGATKMNRPEDIEPNPKNSSVYVILTNNSRRKPEQVERRQPARGEPVRPHRRNDPAGRRPRGDEVHLGHPGAVRRSQRRRGRRHVRRGDQQGRLVRHAG